MRTAIHAACSLSVGLLAAACSTHAPPVAGEPSSPSGAARSGSAVSIPEGAARPERMLRAVLRLTGDGLVVVGLVEAPNTVNRRDPHRDSTAFWRSYDERGNPLEERGFRLETELRAEAPGPDGVLAGDRVPLDEPVFDVAVPLRPGLRTVRFFFAAPGGDRERAEALGEIVIPAELSP